MGEKCKLLQDEKERQKEQIEALKAEKISLSDLVKKKSESVKKYEQLDVEKEKQIKTLEAVKISLDDALKEMKQKCKILQEKIGTMEAVQVSFEEQLKQKHAECKELKERLAVFETMQSVKTKHYSEWNSDALLFWILNLNE